MLTGLIDKGNFDAFCRRYFIVEIKKLVSLTNVFIWEMLMRDVRIKT